ncbi:hypothetical protein I553_10433 [Mycobacterium xenopi 4042]|uniref:Uncharacterized protein n=1 Tax=Mycobacterium xenopi 4042 TaxID=1299334 RepID=X8C9M6_MYCXE|nr:hypothetical protein I553_10433 [Mycobacterium xenopi 4042]
MTDLSDRSATAVAARVLAEKRPGDVTIVSVHWAPTGVMTSARLRSGLHTG